jgi:hypothetical protein
MAEAGHLAFAGQLAFPDQREGASLVATLSPTIKPTGPLSNISFSSAPHTHAMVVPPCSVSSFAHMRDNSP